MADEFVDARRKDDHSVTQRVAVSALPYFPDWEPIPTEDEQDPAQAEGDAGTSEPEADKPDTGGSKSKTTASKTRTTDTSKGRGE